MSDEKKVEKIESMTPEKMLQSIESELKQEIVKTHRSSLKELLKKKHAAQLIVGDIDKEIKNKIKELKDQEGIFKANA